MTDRRLSALLVAGALVVVSACGGDGGDAEPLPPVEQVLADAAAAMSSIETAEFSMSVSGAPMEVQGLTLSEATGTYVAPDRAEAVLAMSAGELSVQLATVSIGERTWLTDPLTGAWTEFPAGVGFNPAALFEDGGFVAILDGGLDEPRLIGTEDGSYVVTGLAAAALVERITAGVIEGQAVEVELSIGQEDDRIVRARFTTSGDEGDSDWVIRLGPFDRPAEIAPPQE